MKTISYLALGDSYTIGESVPQLETFPFLLARKMEENMNVKFSKVKVIAKTGWTTNELQNGIKRAKPKSDFDLVTLLIGVNNQYRGYSINEYQTEFEQLLKQSISLARGNKSKVIVISIPDYGCTPFGAEMAEIIDIELREFNKVAQSITISNQVSLVNIFEISKRAKHQPDLIAEDKLHPSAKMYTLWVNEILPVTKEMFS